jgi:NAD+ kinase
LFLFSKTSLVLLVRKINNSVVLKYAESVGLWMEGKGMRIVVEDEEHEALPQFETLSKLLECEKASDPSQVIDLVVTLGGDGTVLHTAALFNRSVPPLISFNLGSLGFLTRQQLPNYRSDISSLLAGDMFIMLRSRLLCRIMRRDTQSDGWNVAIERQVLNEVVIDKGGSANLTLLDTYCDGVYVTTVQADGIIVSTATVKKNDCCCFVVCCLF